MSALNGLVARFIICDKDISEIASNHFTKIYLVEIKLFLF